jgi:predicted ATP-dependent serine protease
MSAMFTCHQCGVQYAPSFGRCIACGADCRPTAEEEQAVLIDQALTDLVQRRRLREIKRWLISEHDLSESRSDEIAAAALRLYRAKMRRRGNQLAGGGCGLLVLGMIVMGVSVAVGGGIVVLWVGALSIGFALFVTGVLMSWTGRNLAGRGWE